MANRSPLFAFGFSLVVLGVAGCPQETSTSAQTLPPAGLAGTHGASGAASQPAAALSSAPALPASAPAEATASPSGLPHTPGNASQPATGTVIKGEGTQVELEGTVVEVLSVKEYTYLKVKRDSGGEDWAAVLKTDLQPGARVKIAKELWMTDFQSPSLNRSFDRILFGRLVQ